ncbi:unnamed protein product, partial [Closterium sp. NIES-54]
MGAITSVDAAEKIDRASNARVVSTSCVATSSSDTSSVATSISEDELQEVQGEREFSGSAPLRRDASHASAPASSGSHAGSPCDAGVVAGGAEAAALIPGLPDDLATECLLRLPRQEHRAMRRVSRRWNQLIQVSHASSST